MNRYSLEAHNQREYVALCAALPERLFFQPFIPGLEEKTELFGEERVVAGRALEVGKLPSYAFVQAEITEADLLLDALQDERVLPRTEVKHG